jgi:hypothetical protein
LSAFTSSVAAVGVPETKKVFVNVELSLTAGLSIAGVVHIQLAPGMDAVHAELYGVATSAAGFPFTVFVVSLTMAQDFFVSPLTTAIVLVAVLLAKFGSVEVADVPTDAVFTTEVPAGAVTKAVISSVAVELGAILPIVQTPVEDA